jgi:hypothetical protein
MISRSFLRAEQGVFNWRIFFKIDHATMADNSVDMVGPSAQRSTHFGFVPRKIVNAGDSRAMAAYVVENCFDDVGGTPSRSAITVAAVRRRSCSHQSARLKFLLMRSEFL